MALGSIHNLSILVSDRLASEAFYDRVLGFLGYQLIERNDAYTLWLADHAGAITITAAEGGDCPAANLQHLAFSADTRAQVDELYGLLQQIGATILQPPESYPHYAPGYYAVFFADPNGIKLELVCLQPPEWDTDIDLGGIER